MSEVKKGKTKVQVQSSVMAFFKMDKAKPLTTQVVPLGDPEKIAISSSGKSVIAGSFNASITLPSGHRMMVSYAPQIRIGPDDLAKLKAMGVPQNVKAEAKTSGTAGNTAKGGVILGYGDDEAEAE